MDSKDFLQDVLTTAVDTGIGYWAAFRNRQQKPDLTYTSVEVRDREDDEEPWILVNAETLELAINRIIKDPDLKINSLLAADIAEAWMEKDAGMIDAETADIIVQVACYGKIEFS